nr:hypothetical protein [Tanacetum cinerariifolium]
AFQVIEDVPEIYMQEFWATAKLHHNSILINKFLTGKSSGVDSFILSQAQMLWGFYHRINIDFAYLISEDFVYQVEHKNQKRSNEIKKKGEFASSTTPPTPTPTTTVESTPRISATSKEEELAKSDEKDTETGKGGDEDLRLSEEARIQEEEDADELYRDVNINQGRGLQVTQNVENSHVTLTLVNPDGPQESSSMSSFVTSML